MHRQLRVVSLPAIVAMPTRWKRQIRVEVPAGSFPRHQASPPPRRQHPGESGTERADARRRRSLRDPRHPQRGHVSAVVRQLDKVVLADGETGTRLAAQPILGLGHLQPPPHRANRHAELGRRRSDPPRR